MRMLDRIPEEISDNVMRRVAAGYFGLITHLDEQVGKVMQTVDELSLRSNTRILYTSDHGELFGAQGLFGKRMLYEPSVGVPLIFSGPGIDAEHVTDELVSHVDLFPTIVESVGAQLLPEDESLLGRSLWEVVHNRSEKGRSVFAEFHGQASKVGAFMVRFGSHKVIYHVGMPPEAFDLENDPDELHYMKDADAVIDEGMKILRGICDPVAVDARAKADQRKMVEFWGGQEVVTNVPSVVFTPPPGVSAAESWSSGAEGSDANRESPAE
jgi:choline-sulfatase